MRSFPSLPFPGNRSRAGGIDEPSMEPGGSVRLNEPIPGGLVVSKKKFQESEPGDLDGNGTRGDRAPGAWLMSRELSWAFDKQCASMF